MGFMVEEWDEIPQEIVNNLVSAIADAKLFYCMTAIESHTTQVF